MFRLASARGAGWLGRGRGARVIIAQVAMMPGVAQAAMMQGDVQPGVKHRFKVSKVNRTGHTQRRCVEVVGCTLRNTSRDGTLKKELPLHQVMEYNKM